MEFHEIKDHENEAENESDCGSIVAARWASWPIVAGSLHDTVICDSSLSTCDGGGDSAGCKPALVLRRPFPDCAPCEIKITFEQKHEIRQVYVKSTARVYEIYYAASARSMNEYLCTVRCGMAAKTDECAVKEECMPKMATLTSPSSSSSASIKFLEEAEPTTNSNTSTNEDGWVEIKDPDSSADKDGDSSHSGEIEAQRERLEQDFYEATAEISDANPCTSMTIRLLSIQSNESVYLDEVYVFADPVECEDVNSSTSAVECSTGASLMSMFIPTLLQLSKDRGAQQGVLQNLSSPSTSAKPQLEEIPCNKEEVATDGLNCVSDQRTRFEVPTQLSNSRTTTGVDLSPNHIGKMLDELVSRIARIEEFCVRFEEKMTNPIVNMDARLEKVERQLELLNDKFQLPQAQSSTRFRAPEFSCDASVSNSYHNDENANSSSQTPESFKKDDHISDEVPASYSDTPTAACAYLASNIVPPASELSGTAEFFKLADHLSAEAADPVSDAPSAVSAHIVPSLVVTAPEFSYGDEDEETDVIESDKGSLQDKIKGPPSIDDALAFALAGFLSSTSTEQLKIDVDPEPSDTGMEAGTNTLASEHVEFDEPVPVAYHINAGIPVQVVPENGEHEAPHFSTKSDPKVESTAGEDHALRGETADNCLFHEAQDQVCDSGELSADNETVMTEDVEVESADKEAGDSSSEVATKVGSASSEEVTREASDILYTILDLPINSVVDYETPILNVEFSTRGHSSATTSLEALLSDVTAADMESSPISERDPGKLTDEGHLIEPDYSKGSYPESHECFNQDMPLALL